MIKKTWIDLRGRDSCVLFTKDWLMKWWPAQPNSKQIHNNIYFTFTTVILLWELSCGNVYPSSYNQFSLIIYKDQENSCFICIILVLKVKLAHIFLLFWVYDLVWHCNSVTCSFWNISIIYLPTGQNLKLFIII